MFGLDKLLADVLPAALLEQLIKKKLDARGVRLSKQQLSRFAAALLEGKKSVRLADWRFWEHRRVELDVTAADLDAIDKFVAESLSQAMLEACESIAGILVVRLGRTWKLHRRWNSRQIREFRRNLEARWAEPMSTLQMLLLASIETGEYFNRALRASGREDSKFSVEVLTRLHARACQVTGEIIALMLAGFADGAMARWRTLHEIAVITLFVQEGGELVARRYAEHLGVESKRAADEYREVQEVLGLEPLLDEDYSAIEQAYGGLLSKYGAAFRTQYGWAAQALGSEQASFLAIERAVGSTYMRPYYRMASDNVHANPKGAFFKLGLLDETDLLLAGPSNAGLADPGVSTARSLTIVSSALLCHSPTVDGVVALQAMLKLGDRASEAFHRVHSDMVNAEPR